MIRVADSVRVSNVTALMHGGGIKRPNAALYLNPMYYVERMYGRAKPRRRLPVVSEGPTYSVPDRGFLPAASSVPFVDAVAAEGNGELLLFIVNRDGKAARSAEITLPEQPHQVNMEMLAASPLERNSIEAPETVAPHLSSLPVHGRRISISLPACSVSLIRWR
jgi:alpha-L-arabinofuranosidase